MIDTLEDLQFAWVTLLPIGFIISALLYGLLGVVIFWLGYAALSFAFLLIKNAIDIVYYYISK